MATVAEKTVSATESKAKCLDLMDEMSIGRLRCVHITKRGKPFLSMAPTTGGRPSDRLFTVLKGTATVPKDLDLTTPVIDPSIIEAMRHGADD